MFKLHKWPNKRVKSYRTGRPKTQSKLPSAHRILFLTEDLHAKGILSLPELQAAQWFTRAWHRNLSAIGAPRVKTTVLDKSTIRGDVWSEELLAMFEQDWLKARQVLAKQNGWTRQVVDQVLCREEMCKDIRVLKGFLRVLERELSSDCRS